MGLAAALAVVSAVFYGLSAVLQEREASRFADDGVGGFALVAKLAHRRGWWLALLASLGGALLHLAALRAGPLVVVQPIGVAAVAFALLIGSRVNRTSINGRSWAGVACVMIGLPLVFSAVPHHAHGLPAQGGGLGLWPAVLVIAVLVALAVTAAVMFGHAHPRAAAVCFAVGAAMSFGLASGTVKVLMVGHLEPARFVVVAVAMVMGVVLAQHAYRDGGLGAPLAVVTLVDPLTAGALGVMVMGEPFGTSPVTLLAGAAGAIVTSVGVALLAARRTPVVSPAAVGA